MVRRIPSGPVTRVTAGVVYMSGEPTGLRVEVEELLWKNASPQYQLKLQFRSQADAPYDTLVTLPVAAVDEVKSLLDEAVRFVDSMNKA